MKHRRKAQYEQIRRWERSQGGTEFQALLIGPAYLSTQIFVAFLAMETASDGSETIR